MSIFSKHGFFSAVCARKGDGKHGPPVDPDRIMVRAGVRGHVEALQKRFPDLLGHCEIREFAGTDYAFRIFVAQPVWSRALFEPAEETDYDNFTSEVARNQGLPGGAYEHALHEVRSVMNGLQKEIMKTSAAVLVPFLCVFLSASGSAQSGRRPVEPLPGHVVDVAQGEFFLRAPDTIPAGLVTFRLSQIGDRLTNPTKVEAENLAPATPDNDPTRAFHMLWVARLQPGRTVSEWYEAHVKGEPTPWAVDLGGPASAEPPLTSNATMVLEPGNYVLVCHVGSARADKSRSHLLKGMFRALTVRRGSASAAEMPRAHAIARITGTGQIELQGTLRQGPQRIRVINETAKSHEFMVQRVRTGRTAQEAVTWRRTDGTTHPFASLGGFSDVPPGATLTTTIDFGGGDHVLWTLRTPETSLAVRIPER